MASNTVSTQKKGRSRRSGTPWTRGGCITCKSRRKGGCDRATPSCNNCLKLGRICEGYDDLWVAPLGPSAPVFKSTKGPKRRRLNSSSISQPLSPSPSQSSSDPWQDLEQSSQPVTPGCSVPSSPQYRVIDLDVEETSQEQNSEDRDCHSLILKPQGFLSHLSGHEAHYLQYHEAMASQRLANLESAHNPLRSFLIPRAMSSPLLMKAVCAISAMHLSNRTDSLDAKTAAIDFYGRTLRGLRSVMAQSVTDGVPDDAMLAVGMMCKYEVVRGSVKQWVVHLTALHRLLASRGGLGSMDPEAAHFLRGLYVYAYSMGQISNRKKILGNLILADTDMEAPRLSIYLGFTEDILKICACIAELPSLQGDDISLRLAIASTNESLLTWTPSSTRLNIPQDLTQSTLVRLKLVAECFRDAGFVYLHSVLEHMSRDTSPTYNATPQTPYPISEWLSLISTPKQIAIDRLLARIQSFPLDDNCEYSALTFPLFIAGAESDVFEHRDLVLESLGKLQENFGIGNTLRARDVLRILWARRDAASQDSSLKPHWMDILEELQWELTLA
ncbi:C6 transcription factor [Penicillium brasilianum]|uniref:C6 transcription factor n=1 Tax=Penicillium brasilianum TaxID=104259 RepID=A0A1S9RZ92_PENBI|nr:C6 transcription factor [Penicillium brasilianum]